MQHSKIGKISFAVFAVLLVIIALIATSILWTHTLLFAVKKYNTYVGDPYKDNYTIVEITDKQITMVVNNTDYTLFDVMRDSKGSTYLLVHLDENGLPAKRIEPVVSERSDGELFGSDFNLAHELIQSIPMLIVEILILSLTVMKLSHFTSP